MKNKLQLALGFILVGFVLVFLFNATVAQAIFVMLAGGGLIEVARSVTSRKSSCTSPHPSSQHPLDREQ